MVEKTYVCKVCEKKFVADYDREKIKRDAAEMFEDPVAKTAFEAWYDRQDEATMFHCFGCSAKRATALHREGNRWLMLKFMQLLGEMAEVIDKAKPQADADDGRPVHKRQFGDSPWRSDN